MGLYLAIKNKLGKYTWDLAFMDYDESIFYGSEHKNQIHIVKNPYTDKWFADPFILDVNNSYIELLVEEFDKNVQRGRIAKLKIRKVDYAIIDCKIVLDLSTHLSFPAIYRIGDEILVHPENYHSGKSVMYRFNKDTTTLIPTKCLIEEPIADAIIRQSDDMYYMFATSEPDFNGKRLCIYKSNAWDGEYEECGRVLFDSNIARMAGNFQQWEGNVVRPAQDCNGGYGRKVIFQKIKEENGTFSCETIGEFLPPKNYVGLHTFNSYHNNLIVIDLKRYSHPMLHKIYKFFNF